MDDFNVVSSWEERDRGRYVASVWMMLTTWRPRKRNLALGDPAPYKTLAGLMCLLVDIEMVMQRDHDQGQAAGSGDIVVARVPAKTQIVFDGNSSHQGRIGKFMSSKRW